MATGARTWRPVRYRLTRGGHPRRGPRLIWWARAASP